MFETITLANFVLFILISKDLEIIEGDPIIIEYVFTVVKTNIGAFYPKYNTFKYYFVI